MDADLRKSISNILNKHWPVHIFSGNGPKLDIATLQLTELIQQEIAKARKDELIKTFTQVIGDREAPSSRYSKVTRIFNRYLKERNAELSQTLKEHKEK